MSQPSILPVAQPANSPKKTRRKRKVFAEPYYTDLDLGLMSCEWGNWGHIFFLDVHYLWHDLSEMEFYVKRVAKVPGTIRPLAYVDGVEACIAFEAAGLYYYLNTAAQFLEHFGRFPSHDDFLRGLSAQPRIRGAVQEFPDHINEVYAAVCLEQRRRAAKAEKALSLA
ncbi:hypothetical protein C8F01DRAFT_1253195 [Mycena amicta]|nr:hypothetical protein C8F01DRAFT_1253195 [Mycena amicta]